MKNIFCIFFAGLAFNFAYAQTEQAKGAHYLFPEFKKGTILLNNGKTDIKLLNYNTLSEELVFDSQGKMLAVPKEQLARVDTVLIEDRVFVVLNEKFVEVLHNSSWDLFVQYKCDLKEQGKDAGMGGKSQTSAINNPGAVQLGGVVYNLELPEGFDIKRYFTYWLRTNGVAKEIVTMRQLKKMYKQKDGLFDAYVEENNIAFEDQTGIVGLVTYMESN